MLIQILKNEDGTQATIDLIGEFSDGWFGSTEENFVRQFRSLHENAKLTINLNSPGGSIFQALAVRNLLAQHKGEITCNVLGWAASAATFITSLSNVHVRMMQGSFLMIHNPLSVAVGNQNDMRKQADTLDLIAGEMARFYADKSGIEINEVRRLMDAETWFTADEAVQKHLADELLLTAKVAASATADGVPTLGGVALVSGMTTPQSLVIQKEGIMTVNKDAAKTNAAEDKILNNVPEAKEELVTSAEMLKAKYPELVSALIKDAVNKALASERERMKSLDAIRNRAPEIVDKAKYETFADAAQTALEVLQRADDVHKSKAEAIENDAKQVTQTLSKLAPSSSPDAGTSSDLTGTVAASNAWIDLISKAKEK